MKITTELVEEYVRICNDMLHECFEDYDYFDEPSFSIKISKARSFWGSVTSQGGGRYILKISNVFDEIEDVDSFRKRLCGCILHEIIHTLPGCMNHGANFKERCAVVNSEFPGYNLQRCTSMEQYGIKRQRRDYTWQLKCEGCGYVWNYRRIPKYRTNYTCCDCNGTNFTLIRIGE